MYEDIIEVEEENLEDTIPVEEENVIVNTGGTTDHAKLKHLDYESSGHTGFASFENLQAEITARQNAVSNLQEQIDAIEGGYPEVPEDAYSLLDLLEVFNDETTMPDGIYTVTQDWFIDVPKQDTYVSDSIFANSLLYINRIDGIIAWSGSSSSTYLYNGDETFYGGKLTTTDDVNLAIDEKLGPNIVMSDTDQDITGTKTIRATNGLKFRYGSEATRTIIKPISGGMAVAYTNAQGVTDNNFEFSQGYNTSDKNLIPKDNITQNLGKSDKVWSTGYINTLNDGTNNIAVANIAEKQYVADAIDAELADYYDKDTIDAKEQNLIEVAEGKTASYTLSYATTGNEAFNTQNDSVTVTSFIDSAGNTITDANVKVGDVVLILEIGVPDRWVQSIDTTNHTITFYKMETAKIDLNNYVDLDTAQTITGEKTITSAVPLKFAGTYTGQIINQENQLRFKYGGSDKLKISTANITSSAHVIPNSGNTFDLGNSSLKWQHLYLGGSVIWGNSYIQQQGTNIVINPSGSAVHANVDNTKDLGASSKRWRNLYLSGNLSDGTNSVAVADIADKDYVDTKIGDIDTALQNLVSGGGVQ